MGWVQTGDVNDEEGDLGLISEKVTNIKIKTEKNCMSGLHSFLVYRWSIKNVLKGAIRHPNQNKQK